jgi:hypothetical protein
VNARRRTPETMARSATLKMPVLSDPRPKFMKSKTRPPFVARSHKFPSPPPATSAAANAVLLDARGWSAVTRAPTTSTPTPHVKTTMRRRSGNPAPKLRNAPGFRTRSSRAQSPSNDTRVASGRSATATRFVAWSHPKQPATNAMTAPARSRCRAGTRRARPVRVPGCSGSAMRSPFPVHIPDRGPRRHVQCIAGLSRLPRSE